MSAQVLGDEYQDVLFEQREEDEEYGADEDGYTACMGVGHRSAVLL